jgi:hypothetical protein
MWACTSEAHDLSMTNLDQAQQRVSDIRRSREADARIRRLRKDSRTAVVDSAVPVHLERHSRLALTFRRHSLAPR